MTTENLANHTATMLDISTAHITPATRDWIDADLATQTGVLCGAKWAEYGWILWTGAPDKPQTFPFHFPADLATCLHFANRHGIGYLKIDRDGDIIEDLPVYDWEDV